MSNLWKDMSQAMSIRTLQNAVAETLIKKKNKTSSTLFRIIFDFPKKVAVIHLDKSIKVANTETAGITFRLCFLHFSACFKFPKVTSLLAEQKSELH